MMLRQAQHACFDGSTELAEVRLSMTFREAKSEIG